MGHIRMMAAVQPFLSGAISKTVNMPTDGDAGGHPAGLHRGLEARPEGDRRLPRRLQAHAAAQHRRRRRQGHGGAGAAERSPPSRGGPPAAAARRAPRDHPQVRDRRATRATSRSGMYEDGTPGEIFITMAKEGTTISGLMDSFAHLDLDGAAVRRAARGAGRASSVTCASSPRGSRRTRRSRSRRASPTTSSAGSASKFLTAEQPGGGRGAGDRASRCEPHSGPVRWRAVRRPCSGPSSPGAPCARRPTRPVPRLRRIMIRNGSCYRCAQLRLDIGLQLEHRRERPGAGE